MNTKSMKERAEAASKEIQDILGVSADSQPQEITDAVEKAITEALLVERSRCANVALNCIPDHDKANLVSEEIRRVNTALIANLSALR